MAPVRGVGRARRRARALAAAAALAMTALSCPPPGSGRPPVPEPALRLWTPGVARWTGDQRVLRLAVENGSDRSVEVAEPHPDHVGVVLYTGPADDRACARDPVPGPATGEKVTLAPGEVRDLRLDLGAACGRIPPGEYRYVAVYDVSPAGAGPPLRLRPRYGLVVVEASPPSLDRGSIGSGGGGPEGGRGSGEADRVGR